MEDKVFVGIGKNPDPSGLDMPIGFGMQLYQSPEALHYFAALSQKERNDIIRYIEDSKTGEEAKKRINTAVKNLNNRNANFFNVIWLITFSYNIKKKPGDIYDYITRKN